MGAASDVFAAIADGNVKQVRQLVDEDANLAAARNEAGVSALMTAAYHQKAEIVALLQRALTELDVFESVAVGDIARLRKLLEHPANAVQRSADGFTPLHFAAFFNKLEAAELLLAAGADVGAVADNPSQVQPLHSAAASRSIEVAKLLLEHGANPNARQYGGWTALQSAAKHGQKEMIDVLLAAGADSRQAANDGQTALSMACSDAVRAQLEK
jgi:ankyrin repeat protein